MILVRLIGRNTPGQGRVRVWEVISLPDGSMGVKEHCGAETWRVH